LKPLELLKNAQDYIERIEAHLDCSVTNIGVGEKKEQ